MEKLTASGLVVAFGSALVFAIVVCVRAASRGLDLTDEGIYLITYRWYQHPELTFTSSSAIFGPLFRLFGWNVAALRIIKLVLILVTSYFLGASVYRFFGRRLAVVSRFGRVEHLAFVLMVTFGGITLYSWLPQSPGYNDLAIFLATLVLATSLLWIDAAGTAARLLAVAIGFQGMLLLFVKWPSAFGVATVIIALFVGVGAAKRFFVAVPMAVVGGIGALGFIQLTAGKLITRVTSLSSSSGTVLKGVNFKEAYLDSYLSDFRSVAGNLVGIEAISAVAIVGVAVVVSRFSRSAALVLSAVGLGAGVVLSWRKQWFVGGWQNVRGLEILFPFLALLALGFVVFTMLCGRQKSGSHLDSSVNEGGHERFHRAREVWVGVAAVIALPLAQALGTGNPPLTIAACAGASWTAGIAVLLLIGVNRGGIEFAWPALVLVAALGLAPLSLGVRGLWQQPFRVTGGMSAQTVAAPALQPLNHLKVDPNTADVLTQVYEVLQRNNLVGRPGLTTFNGTGFAFALGLRHPPSGIFMEEALPEVLKVRIKEACDQGALTPKNLPVVLTAGGFPTATQAALQACGIAFPGLYVSEVIKAKGVLADGTVPQQITVWIPQS